jgi:uncharacterized protein (TIGR02646 family)
VIRIDKSKTAPTKLIKEGKTKTDSHILEYNQSPQDYQSGKKKFSFSNKIYGDSSVKQALILAQHKKCCFCERLIGYSGDIEHFRPKSAYCQTNGRKIERPGYFWLAYNWDNLYLSCNDCNQRQKKNLFLLADPSTRAQLKNNDITLEKPLFVNPGHEDPSQHIGFRGEVPYAVPESIKGEPTIKMLKLDRDDLNEWRLKHLREKKLLFQFVKSSAKLPQNKKLRDLVSKAEKNLQHAISDQGEFAAATREAIRNQFEFVTD